MTEILECEHCGAPHAPDAKRCEYCGMYFALKEIPRVIIDRPLPVYNPIPIIHERWKPRRDKQKNGYWKTPSVTCIPCGKNSLRFA